MMNLLEGDKSGTLPLLLSRTSGDRVVSEDLLHSVTRQNTEVTK